MIYLVYLALFSTARGYVYIAGYEPESDVYNHSLLDLDQRDIVTYVGNADWAMAKDIYENGKHSIKATGVIRTMKGFSVNDCKQKGEKYFDIFNNYWVSKGLTDCQYADVIMQAALDGTAVASTGFSFDGEITGSDDFREQAIMKGVLYLNVFMYTIWEMQDAINDCNAGDLDINDGAVHAWDEAVAFYTGSLEGTLVGGKYGLYSGTAYMMFTLAEKRCINFGTCTDDYDGNSRAGYSAVNDKIFADFERMKAYLVPNSTSQTFNCENAYTGKDRIVSQMLVPMVQGALRYLYETDSRIEPNGATEKELGELWAFVTGILPIIDYVDPSVADDLYTYTWGQDMSGDDFASMKIKLESTYAGLNITCDDIGTLCDKSFSLGCIPYSDGERSFDTSKCLAASTSTSSSDDDDDNDGILIFLIIGCVVLFVVCLVLLYWNYVRGKQYEALKEQTEALTSVTVQTGGNGSAND